MALSTISDSFHGNVDFNSVISYKNRLLVNRLCNKLNITREEAEQVFSDMKMFLFLAGTTNEPLAPTEKIDEAWHNFILFTKDYRDFCLRYFGKFIHHVPTDPDNIKSKDGNVIARTKMIAKTILGPDLSDNWRFRAADCEKCSGSTNCQNKCNTPCSKECSHESEEMYN